MTILYFTLSVLLMISLPVIFGAIFKRHFKVPWYVFLVGSLTFALSQVVHLPLNNWLTDIGLVGQISQNAQVPLIQSALILGLTAGLCEEIARAVSYWIMKKNRNFGDAIVMGIGHGGIESMVIGGVLLAATVSSLFALQGTDLSTLGLSLEQLDILEGQMQALDGGILPAVLPLFERLLAMTLHIIFSFIVWQAFNKRNFLYVVLAILYHTLLDAGMVYIGVTYQNNWLLFGFFIVCLIPGLIWLVINWRKNKPEQSVIRVRFSTELNAFLLAFRKELLEQWRTKKVLIILVVFVLFGMLSPLLAKFTPEIIKSVEGAEMFADMIPEPTAADAMGQYIKNITQFGFILAILLGMGAIASEKEKGITPMILSKPLPRWGYILSKFLAQFIVYAAGFLIAGLGAWYYTWVLFGAVNPIDFLLLNGLLLEWIMVYAAITIVGSTIGKNTGAAAGISLGVSVLFLLLGNLPTVGPLMPSGLTAWASQLGLDAGSASNAGAAAMSLVFIVIAVLSAIAVFEKQEL